MPQRSGTTQVLADLVGAQTYTEEQRELNRTLVEEAADDRPGKYMKEMLLADDEYDPRLATAADVEAALDACDDEISPAELTALRKIFNEVSKGEAITNNDLIAAEAALKAKTVEKGIEKLT